ncbi:MAG: uroporphyrinogen-III synthase, partial [Gammaproteobacteria bacterium]|nr:uroporphyrinogen-III synthase [Gammaproteobacteria bacterium]
MPNKVDKPLKNIHVLVTRPEHQADQLCKLIEQSGGTPERFATIEISSLSLDVKQIHQLVSQTDIAIFISQNAVEFGLKPLLESRINMPAKLRFAAVGQATARALNALGISDVIQAEAPYNSESLLACNELQNIAEKHIIIFKGTGGRELLIDTLKQRGASVHSFDCYSRNKPTSDSSEVSQQLKKQAIDFVVCTSNEGLDNLVDLIDVDNQESLFATKLVVLSERGAGHAKTLGFETIIQAHEASDRGIQQILIQWVESNT